MGLYTKVECIDIHIHFNRWQQKSNTNAINILNPINR